MANYQHIDYATTYFPHKLPTLTRGEPTYKDLKRVKMELRANASSIDSELGGGDHGYLGLVLTDPEYLAVPGVSGHNFIPPPYPGPLIIDPAASDVQAIQARDLHLDNKRNYRECTHIEKALLKHLQGSFQPHFFEMFVDDDTALLTSDIPTILTHLFSRYGQVSGTDVQDCLNEVLKTPFTPADPLVTLWNPIQKLNKLATQARIPYSEQQLIEFALQMIRGTHDFENALGKWEEKPITEKTWQNLKLHFSQAQNELKKIRGPTMVQAGFHQINMIASEIRGEFSQTREELANMTAILQRNGEDQSDNLPFNTSTIPEVSAPNIEQAMATTESSYQLEMMKLLKSMQEEISKLNRGGFTQRSNGGGSTYSTAQRSNENNGNKKGKKTPDNPTFERRTTNQYCWTHGGCAHKGAQCTMKAQGHKNDATFENKMGGSKGFCE